MAAFRVGFPHLGSRHSSVGTREPRWPHASPFDLNSKRTRNSLSEDGNRRSSLVRSIAAFANSDKPSSLFFMPRERMPDASFGNAPIVRQADYAFSLEKLFSCFCAFVKTIARRWKFQEPCFLPLGMVGGAFLAKKPREPLLLRGEFSISKPMNREEIKAIIKEIVAQDAEYYPAQNASFLNAGPKYFQYRWYCIGGWEFTLQTLAGRFRKAEGIAKSDKKFLPDKEVVRVWRREIFQIEKIERAREVMLLDYPKLHSGKLREAEMDEIVRAIVTQDSYYDGKASKLLVNQETLVRRRYCIGSWEFTLGTLAGRVRQARKLRAGDTEVFSNQEVFDIWRKRIFGIEKIEKVREVIVLTYPLFLAELTEAEIGEIVKTIVVRDPFYGGDASKMKTTPRCFEQRWYRIGQWEFTLHTLAGKFRNARGYNVDDTKALSRGKIISIWKETLFGISTASSEG